MARRSLSSGLARGRVMTCCEAGGSILSLSGINRYLWVVGAGACFSVVAISEGHHSYAADYVLEGNNLVDLFSEIRPRAF
jgi:hypothetical protein